MGLKMNLFNEIYSIYYQTVAKIITEAFKDDVREKDLEDLVMKEAFSESFLTILPSLKSQRWPLLDDDLKLVLKHIPSMPLSTLEKRWLKAISLDPRIKLFKLDFSSLNGIEPLFTAEDYRIYDQYNDGDKYDDERYINNFNMIKKAINEDRAIIVKMNNRHGEFVKLHFYPKGFEYSLKDDKIRIIAEGCHYRYFNLARIIECDYYDEEFSNEKYRDDKKKELQLMIYDGRNTLERAMLHFAHFEKEAERQDDGNYLLYLKYYEYDETEILIRVLSFGPYIKVIEPDSFIKLIKERLIKQRNCEL